MIEYYNIIDSGLSVISFILPGILFVLLSLIILYVMKKYNAKPKKIRNMYFLLGFSVLWSLTILISTGVEYKKLSNIYKNEKYSVVEGYVKNFKPKSYFEKVNETFSVNGVPFKIRDSESRMGFNTTKSHGGPIDEGEYVRIKYYEGIILQLQIRE